MWNICRHGMRAAAEPGRVPKSLAHEPPALLRTRSGPDWLETGSLYEHTRPLRMPPPPPPPTTDFTTVFTGAEPEDGRMSGGSSTRVLARTVSTGFSTDTEAARPGRQCSRRRGNGDRSNPWDIQRNVYETPSTSYVPRDWNLPWIPPTVRQRSFHSAPTE